MTIRERLWLTSKTDGSIWSNFSGRWIRESDPDKIRVCRKAWHIMKCKYSDEEKQRKIDDCLREYASLMKDSEQNDESLKLKKELTNRSICESLINFFSEFDFEPNFRFVNTLKRAEAISYEQAQNYVSNYFSLVDNQYADNIAEKVKSREFISILDKLETVNLTTFINNRLQIFFGSQGTGKTTEALKLSNNVVMVCHSAMLPSDLMEDFEFVNGQPSFKKSSLWNAMEDGMSITLDEINLLPFESLRFLQSLLDNKKSIMYKGHTINIKDGFQIIGTMNLRVNGSIFNLPEPLVDRASNLVKYTLTAKQLAGALE